MADIYFDVDAALSEVPVNIFPLTDDTDFKTREASVAYNATGMDLVWNFVTTAGAYTQTAVTPTTGGAYDWAHQGDGMYSIEIPASGGASINNDTEGFGWFTGICTGVLPWRSPVFGFRAAALNNALIDGGDLLDVNVTHIADTAQTGRDVGASVLLSAGTGTGQVSLSSGAVTVGTNNDKTGYTASTVSDKTGYSLASSQTFNVTGNITGNLSGSVGSVTGAVGSVTGGVTVTTNNDKTGYALTVTPPTAAAIADAVCDEALSGHSTPGTVGIAITDTLGYSTATRTALTDLRAAALDRIVGTLATGTHNPQSGDTYAIVNNGTYGNSALETLVDGIETSLAAGVTVTTNNDKTGYSLTVTPPTAAQVRAEIDSNSTQLAAIVADTAEIQSELADGGRTDLLIDGIKAKTDQLTFTTPNSVDATATVSTAGLATEANQTTIINHLTDVKGATFSGATDSLEAIRNRGDVAWITGGTGGGSNAVTINVKDDNAANVVDCYVEIWDSAGTSFISRTNTNSSGDVTFNLDSNTYIVKMHKTGYYFANQTLVVDGVESEAYTGTILTPDAATDPTLCRIYGYYFDPAGATYSAVKSLIKLTAIYEASDNNYYTSELVGTYNTTTGLLYFDVIQGASVTLEIPILNVKKSFVVPATTLYKISDIA